jgi:fatty acid desaturase
MQGLWRHTDGALPNLLALSYVLTGYLCGFGLIMSSMPWANAVGVLLLAHAMVIGAYLIHECAHNTIFADNAHNARLGEALGWITGSCYADYEDVRHKHFRHHVDRADVVAFDYRERLGRYPALLCLMNVLEWLYVPAVEVMMHALVIVLPFVQPNRRHRRVRVALILAVRAVLLAAIAWQSPRVLVLYPLAYMAFLTVMRFMDTHQHTYEIFETLDRKRGVEAQRFDTAYEERNTFSNLLSVKHPWLNLLVLNFCYHNAHHTRPTVPWYRLPALHRELYDDETADFAQALPFFNLLYAFHRYRVPRMLNADAGDVGVQEDRGRHFVGVDGVSFMTTH